MKNLLLLVALLSAPFINTAQSVAEEQAMRTFARDFMAAYNRQDVPALQAMFTAGAVSIVDGTVTEGAEKIALLYTDRFIREEVTLLVRQTGLHWSDAQHAWMATGTYESFGQTYVYDIPFSRKTAYSNTMIQENGRWKIARSVVTSTARTLVYQKSGDLAAWKSALTGALQGSGVLTVEWGTSSGDPDTGYALLEWPSPAAARTFFADAAWQKIQPKGKKPAVVYLEAK